MKQNLRLGDCYIQIIRIFKCPKLIHNSLLAVLTIMCLEARAQSEGADVLNKFRASDQPSTAMSGIVVDTADQPIIGATVGIKGTPIKTQTDSRGYFSIRAPWGEQLLEIAYLGHQTIHQKIDNDNRGPFHFILLPIENMLQEVEVSTGYQTIPKERATGSFVQIDNELLNRSVSTNILDRLKGVASGVLFDQTTGNSTGFSIRGRSTIFANTEPLIIVDNFPYDGDLSTINPNDVESVSILRDAAAASIWGVRASNGVVVITTKSGRLNEPIKITINSNVTVGEKPRLYSAPQLGPRDIVELEQFLYEKGAYTNAIARSYTYISPVVQILSDRDRGLISEAEASQQIMALQSHDMRDDEMKYYYRNTWKQQYALSISGGGRQNRYYLSAGYDKNLQELVSNSNDRLTINAQNTYFLLNNRLQASAGINLSVANTITHSGNILNTANMRAYTRLADEHGNHLAVPTYKQAWLDTVGAGKLLDWTWKPLDELERSNNNRKLTNYLLNLNLAYKLLDGLDLAVKYQYGSGATEINDLSVLESYYTRNMINTFSQIDAQTGEVVRPVPLGDILSRGNMAYQSHQLRGQISFDRKLGLHDITAIAGAEVKDYNQESNFVTLYGYDQNLGTVANIDHANQYRNFVTGSNTRIGGSPSQSGATDRYVSMFANALYTYRDRYSFSASARRDESNIFGVKANQKGVPLWSLGASWAISKEEFFALPWVTDLKLRITNGYNGNVDKTLSAYVTAQASSRNSFGGQMATLVNPPNPSLRWEKVNMTNLAVDFVLFGNRLSGSLEYYYKKGKDIIGSSPLPPSTGIITFRGNSADISGNGVDVSLTSRNIARTNFSWQTTFLLSRTTDKIDDYKANTTPLGFHVGYPYNGLFTFRWAGLDPENGDPRGYLNGAVSSDWGSIANTDSLGDNIVYNGSRTPVYFGSLRNSLSVGNWSFSFNLIYKLGHYFVAPTVNYGSLYSLSLSHIDYNRRWKQPGDEAITIIPSAAYPANFARDNFFTNADVLVQNGAQLRLQDIQVTYDFRIGKSTHPLNTRLCSIYLYANNLGLVWKANRQGLDPEYLDLAPQRYLSLGFKTSF